MSLEKIVEIIKAKGIEGIKKAELRREFQAEEEFDSILQELVNTHEIFIEKKGNAFYCWHKNYYLQRLLSTDQKFSFLYSMMNSMQDSFNMKFDSISTMLDTVTEQVTDATQEIKILLNSARKDIANDKIPQSQSQTSSTIINYDNFKGQLDQALANASSSIGWVELCNLRKNLCLRMNISREQFYHTFEEVVSNNYDKYELSTGGEEGIQLRGMVHGYVRCI